MVHPHIKPVGNGTLLPLLLMILPVLLRQKRLAGRSGQILFLILLLLVVTTSSPCMASHADTGKLQQTTDVLIFNSYHQGFQWTDEIVAAVTATMSAKLNNIDFHVEYMDSKRHNDKLLDEALYKNLALKFESSHPDIVITSDDNALDFIKRHHQQLFPDIPVVFCGVNNVKNGLSVDRRYFTGLIETLDMSANIDLARRLLPGLNKVVIVSDGTTTGIGTRKMAMDAEPEYPDIEFTYLNGEDLNTDEMLNKLHQIKMGSAVIAPAWYRDKDGKTFDNKEIYPRIAEASSVPVFGTSSANLGFGIIGGKLNSGTIQGEYAAKQALRILSGEVATKDLPVETASQNRYMFDYLQLIRFGLAKQDLPPGATILNRPVPLYELYKTETAIAVMVFLSFVIIITSLLWNIRRRKKVEQSLIIQKHLAEQYLDIAGVILVAIDDQAKVTLINRKGQEVLGYEKNELLGKDWFKVCLPSEENNEVYKVYRGLMAGKIEAFKYNENRICTKNGEERLVAWSNVLLKDEYGNIIGLLSSGEDITERKQAEEALRRSEFFLKRSQEIGRIGSFVLNNPRDQLADQTWQCTPTMDEIFGIGAGFSKTGENWLKLIIQRDEVSEYFSRQIAKSQHFFEKEYQILRPLDGEIRWIKERGDFEFDDQGRCMRLIGTVLDITEQKQIEQDRLAHLQFFEGLDRINRAIQAVSDVEQMMSDVLDVVISVFNCDRANLLYPCDPEAKTCTVPMARGRSEYPIGNELGLVVPVEREMAQAFRILLYSDSPVTFGPDSKHPVPQSVSQNFEIKSTLNMALYPKTGKPWQFSVHQCSYARVWTVEEEKLFKEIGRRFTDALTSLLMYRDLRKSEAFLNSLVDNIPNMIFVKDAETLKFVMFNKAGEQLLGYSREEMIGKSDYDFFPSDEADFFTSKDREVFTRKISVDVSEETIMTGNNEQRILHTKKIPLLDEEGKPQYLLGISEDITDHRKLEEQLRQAQKMEAVGQLAGGIAHDFNNMLGVIIGNAEIAMMEMDTDSPFFNRMQGILKAAERSADMTRQLLAFARKQSITPRVLDLNSTIEGMLKMLRHLIGENIDLAWLPRRSVCPVKMDPSQIDQILANLCVNARDAIAGVGKVHIATDMVIFDETNCIQQEGIVPGDFVMLMVSDNGQGMDKKTLERVFEPFFTTKEIGKGTGLGLATVYGIVKQNNGFINIYSEIGIGTTFKVYLPRYIDEIEPMQMESLSPSLAQGDETVLVVEDEPAMLGMVSLMLENCGYQVLTASRPSEAIQIAKTHSDKIDLLITDLVMPEMYGHNLAKEIHSLWPRIKCLFMSGYSGNITGEHGPFDKDTTFIQKPFNLHSFAVKVRETLDQKLTERLPEGDSE